jgi:phage FluMu protein gp41
MATKKPHPLGFEIINGQLHGALRVGMRVKGHLEKRFVMREALVEDLLAAEDEAPVDKPLAFNGALILLQLVRVGESEGPFVAAQLGALKPVDWRILRAAQAELDALGEDVLASVATT